MANQKSQSSKIITEFLEPELRLIIESSPDGIVIADKDGRIFLVNKMIENIFGYSREELLGQYVEIFLPQDIHARHKGYREEYMQEPSPRSLGRGRDLYGLTKNKKKVRVEVGLTPIHIKGELYILASVIDITERKKVEEELLRSNEELEQFAYAVSHDIKDPLNVARNSADLLIKMYKDKVLDKKAEDFLEHIISGLDHMRALIDGLLEYGRVGTRSMPVSFIDCNECVKQAVDNLQVAIAQAQAKITVEEKLPIIYGDKILIIELFQNLIANALKFRCEDASSVISIYARKDLPDDMWVIGVKDNGAGIRQEDFGRIFEVFYRGYDKNCAQSNAGIGLGLALCKKIIERHGGKITIESEHGKGSTFYIFFPKH